MPAADNNGNGVHASAPVCMTCGFEIKPGQGHDTFRGQDFHESPDDCLAPLFDAWAQIARLTKDGECPECLQDGSQPNPECREHRVWVMENDDAVETLHSIISEARQICARRPE